LLSAGLLAGIGSVRAQHEGADTAIYHAPRISQLSDTALLNLVQQQTLGYFWEFAHPVSGMARERSNGAFHYGLETVTTGGTGFGIMAIVTGVERQWIKRDTAIAHLLKMVGFLEKADRYHGIYPHWLNGETGKTIPFSQYDNGADIVESAYLFQGLLAARAYFDRNSPSEDNLRQGINALWREANWKWHTQQKSELFWHWSPDFGWKMNFSIRGWNECLIAFVLAASSPTHPIDADVYHKGWASGDHFLNRKTYYGVKLPLGFPYGGPLFFSQYSFLGLNPHLLRDRYANYWQQNLAHTQINYRHCVTNPKGFAGYAAHCWGLTASDSYDGYDAHSPDNDLSVISPTAALSAFPYTPKESMVALRHFYDGLGDKIWGRYGFVDAFSVEKKWYAQSYLAIDQGPIVVMIENYRSGLLWKLFMQCPEIKQGLVKLGFDPVKN
jgi:hypothetical protein